MSFDRFDDADFEVLKARLNTMPTSPLYAPRLTHPFATARAIRKMARMKRKASRQNKPLFVRSEVAFYQPVGQPANGGWYSFSSDVSEETVKQIQGLLDARFNKKNLTVESLQVLWAGFHDGQSGTYTTLRAVFTVV